MPARWANDAPRCVARAWLLFRRATYGSAIQRAGIIFNRNSALAYDEAMRGLIPILGREPQGISRHEDENGPSEVKLERADTDIDCTGAPDLDFKVLSRRVDRLYVTAGKLPLPYNVHA